MEDGQEKKPSRAGMEVVYVITPRSMTGPPALMRPACRGEGASFRSRSGSRMPSGRNAAGLMMLWPIVLPNAHRKIRIMTLLGFARQGEAVGLHIRWLGEMC